MKLPALLYGRGRDAHRETKKVMTRLRRGMTLSEAVEDLGGLVEVEDKPGGLVLEGPSPVTGARTGFHLYRLLQVLQEHHRQTLFEPLEGDLFDALVTCEWGVAVLLSDWARIFFLNHEMALADRRYLRFLDAAVTHWLAFEGIGPRWSPSGFDLGRPLACSRTLVLVLMRCNIPVETIDAERHLGLPELLRRHPPRPEAYQQPDSRPRTFANEEEQRAVLRTNFVEIYELLTETHRPSSQKLARERARVDTAARRDGFDPAQLDPHWHERPDSA